MGETFQLMIETFQVSNPYKEIKSMYNKLLLDSYDDIRAVVDQSDNPLLTALKVAVIGNIIDFGHQSCLLGPVFAQIASRNHSALRMCTDRQIIRVFSVQHIVDNPRETGLNPGALGIVVFQFIGEIAPVAD